MRKKFLHCLRIQFPPKHYEDERIAEVVDYCVKYGFKNVMLFINAEEYNVGLFNCINLFCFSRKI